MDMTIEEKLSYKIYMFPEILKVLSFHSMFSVPCGLAGVFLHWYNKKIMKKSWSSYYERVVLSSSL